MSGFAIVSLTILELSRSGNVRKNYKNQDLPSPESIVITDDASVL